MSLENQSPRVRANDWSVLAPPEIGDWTPTRSVSVVIPAFRAAGTLGQTLASLAGQSYPEHLLEVVVVDDEGELDLPEIRPERTRVVRTESSWGRAAACATGADRADGDVIAWLDADMLVHRYHIEAQMRWHHLIDYAVVLGHKFFIDPADEMPPPGTVRSAVEADTIESLLGERWQAEHEWVERYWQDTGDLVRAGYRAHQVHVGATASVGASLYRDSGGMDASLKLGEDIELGFRLSSRGGVFIGDREARSWHLGRSTLMQNEVAVKRYNNPHLAHLLPDLRRLRRPRGRSYRVPMFEVVVDANGHSYEDVRHTLDGILEANPGDVTCVAVGPWDALHDARRSPLTDQQLDYRLMFAEYEPDPRVRLLEAAPESSYPAVFGMQLPAGWRPEASTMPALLKDMQKRAQGLRQIVLEDGQIVRIERTAAVQRALRVIAPGEELDDALDAVSHTWWSNGAEDGFIRRGQERPQPSSRAPDRAVRERSATRAHSSSPDTESPLAADSGGNRTGRAGRTARRLLHIARGAAGDR